MDVETPGTAEARPPEIGGTALFLCDTDSQVFGTVGLARALAAAGVPVTYGLFGGPLPAGARRLVDAFDVVETTAADVFSRDLVGRHKVVGFYSHGSRINAFRTWFADAFPGPAGTRPVIFTGFNGLILDKFEEGAAWRAGYDVVVVPGPRDVDLFRHTFAGGPAGGQRLVAAGLGHAQVVERTAERTGRRRLVFAEQSVIPSSRGDRAWLAAQLVRLARENPGWDVVVKVRVGPGDRTFHSVKHHFADLAALLDPLPGNFEVSAGSLAEELARADLMMTVSSTAAFEAIRSGVPVVAVGDLGIANALGTHVFANSGFLLPIARIGSLDAFEPPRPNPEWLADIGLLDDPGAFVRALAACIADAAALPPPLYGEGGPLPLPMRFEFADAVAAARRAIADGRMEEAADHLGRAARLRPDHHEVRLLRALAEGRIAAWSLAPRLRAAETRDWLASAASRVSGLVRRT